MTGSLQVPSHPRAVTLMVTSSCLISFSGLIVRSMETADAWQINFYRGLSLFFAVGIVLILRYRRQTLTSVLAVGRSGVFGAFLLSITGICFLQALTRTSVANTLFILSAIPFFTALFAWLILRERINRVTLLAMLVATAGIVVMVSAGVSIGNGFGNLMALLTAVLFASYAVIIRRKRHVDMLPVQMISALFIMLTAAIVRHDDLLVPWRDVLLCFLWGGLIAGFTNWMFIVAARTLAAAELTLFMLLEFSLGPIWVWLFIDESPTRETLAGGVLVISAVAIWAALQMQRRKNPVRNSGPDA